MILLKMESSASSSNSADADAATSLEVSKPHQPRTFSFHKHNLAYTDRSLFITGYSKIVNPQQT